MLRAEYRALLWLIAADDLAHVVEPDLPFVAYDDVAAQLSDLAVAALRAALVVGRGHGAAAPTTAGSR